MALFSNKNKKSKEEQDEPEERQIPEAKGLDEEDLDEEDLELLEQEKKRKFPQNIQKSFKQQEPQIKERFVVFSQSPRIGIMDRETNEVIAEGEALIPQALARILESLERIEANLGSMIGGD